MSTTGLDSYYYISKAVPEDLQDEVRAQLPGTLFSDKHDANCETNEQYVGAWAWQRDDPSDQTGRHHKMRELMNFPEASQGSPHLYACPHQISLCAAYWRKANAIHNWFVQNCGGGVDECQEIEVSNEALGQLIFKCRAALAAYDSGKIDEAGQILTPTPGFFFGSTEVDDYWKADLEDTVKQLVPLAEFPGRMYYRASW